MGIHKERMLLKEAMFTLFAREEEVVDWDASLPSPFVDDPW